MSARTVIQRIQKGFSQNPFWQFLFRGVFIRRRPVVVHLGIISVLVVLFTVLWITRIESAGLVLQREQNYFFSQSLGGFVVMMPYWVAGLGIVNSVVALFLYRLRDRFAYALFLFTEIIISAHFGVLFFYLIRYQLL